MTLVEQIDDWLIQIVQIGLSSSEVDLIPIADYNDDQRESAQFLLLSIVSQRFKNAVIDEWPDFTVIGMNQPQNPYLTTIYYKTGVLTV